MSNSSSDQSLENEPNPDQEYPEDEEKSSSDSDSDSDDSLESEEEREATEERGGEAKETPVYIRPGDPIPESENTPEKNIKLFSDVLGSKRLRKELEQEDRRYKYHEDWREEDLQELWADAPLAMTKPGWDPVFADEEDWNIVREEIKEGPVLRPLPQALPDDHYDISNPKAVIEELDRIEEFLQYEGTVWDDLAHGKGVYVAEQWLVRYEGEWFQNTMEGHGVVEAKMRAEGKIIARDYMTPEDIEWLEKDVEDSVRLAGGTREIPFYERDEWVRQFGRKPEKGRYRYAGQWKQGKMHGCGVYEVNERTIYGRFYFGELLQDSTGGDVDVSALHSGIAEIAAGKARMF